MQEMWVQSLDQDDPTEKEMATHSSILAYILAWAISRTEEPCGLQSAKQLDMTCRLNNKTVIPLHYNTEFFYFKP